MHFYQENREKNLLKRHHSPQNHQSKGCTAEFLHTVFYNFDTKKYARPSTS